MKPQLSRRRGESGMSLFEVGVVVAMVLLLAAVLLYLIADNKRKSEQMACVDNLKQVGLAYRIWEGDNGDIYPMGISITNGGSMEMVATGDVVRTFLVMSNELGTPNILYCPNDATRSSAMDFNGLANSNISYFVDVDTTNDTTPDKPLSGDSNLKVRGLLVKSGLLSVWTNDPMEWNTNRHGTICGNIGFADGSVQTAKLVKSHYSFDFQFTGLATNRLAIP
jgi:prepilin-type processing-associated H-X9-DG protein